jgi:hypothetical protein
MLQSVRNKATVSILDKLKQKGMPAPGAPMGAFDQEPDYNQLDANGQVLQEPGITPEDLTRPKALKMKKKPLSAPSEDEAVY